MSHPAHVYTTFEAYAATRTNLRKARRTWNRHVAKHGNVPLVVKCAICSGAEFRGDVKRGRYRPARPSKRLRDELRNQETHEAPLT